MNTDDCGGSATGQKIADCGAANAPIPESLTDPSLSQFNLPVVYDNHGNKYQVVWMDPVHPKCRIISREDVAVVCKGIEVSPTSAGLLALARALRKMLSEVVLPKGDLRRN